MRTPYYSGCMKQFKFIQTAVPSTIIGVMIGVAGSVLPPPMIEPSGDLGLPANAQFTTRPCGSSIEKPISIQVALARATSKQAPSSRPLVSRSAPDCPGMCELIDLYEQVFADWPGGTECHSINPYFRYRRFVQVWHCPAPTVQIGTNYFCTGWDFDGCAPRAITKPGCPKPRCARSDQ